MKHLFMALAVFVSTLSLNAQENASSYLVKTAVFGKSASSGDFRLSQANRLTVDREGNIVVVDAQTVKLFSPGGRGLKMVEPGEIYSVLVDLHRSPEGFFTIQTVNGFSLFSPGMDYLGKVSFIAGPQYTNVFRRLKIHMAMPDKQIALNGLERVFSGEAAERLNDGTEQYINALIYDRNDSLSLLARYEITNKIWTGRQSHSVPMLGSLHWTVIPGNRIVFTHTGYDCDHDAKTYTLFKKTPGIALPEEIIIPYTPVVFADSLLKVPGPGLYQLDMTITDVRKIFREKYEAARYYPPVKELLTDDQYIYVIQYRQRREEHPQVDIIDIETGQLVNSWWFPFVPASFHDGKVYNIHWEDQKRPEIEVYEINPALYAGRNRN